MRRFTVWLQMVTEAKEDSSGSHVLSVKESTVFSFFTDSPVFLIVVLFRRSNKFHYFCIPLALFYIGKTNWQSHLISKHSRSGFYTLFQSIDATFC